MTIFVSVASYKDTLLKFTLLEAYNNAKNKEEIVFGVVEQESKDSSLDLNSLPFKNQIRYVRVDPEQSRGCCWARNIIQSLYRGEKYYLQIDSHTAFDLNWDETLISSLESLRPIHPKIVLTRYPDELFFEEDGRPIKVHQGHSHVFCSVIEPPRPNEYAFSSKTSRHIIGRAYSINLPRPASHGFMLSAGGLFTLGEVIEEVPYDPFLFFSGEETTLALRLWTNGWNIFHPNKMPLFHFYTDHEKRTRKLFWDESEEEKRNFSWNTINNDANERVEKILTGQITGAYGLGNKRSLEDYKLWSGIDYINKEYKPSFIWKHPLGAKPEDFLENYSSYIERYGVT